VLYSGPHNKYGFDQIIALCQEAEFSPHIVQKASSEQAVLSLVTAGAGITIVVRSMHTIRADEVTYQCLIDPVYEGTFGTVWRLDNPSPLVKPFIQTAHEIALGKAIG
jgi:DNA-binding transcriptional LysR family regulator